MEIFVTGGTGVLGRATIPLLVAAGHRLRGASRSAANDAALRHLGAEPTRTDLFDPVALAAAVAGSDAILHLATRIPPSRRAGAAKAWRENDRLRREGTRNLVDAALAAGVGVFVYPSVTFVYPDSGDRWLDAETTPPAADPPPILRSTLDAEATVARFAAAGGRGVVLRLGGLYGPGAAHTTEALALARRGLGLMLGDGAGYQSSLWIPDAGAALATALESERAASGVYDVVDDEPLPRDHVAAAVAAAVGRRRLRHPPPSLLRLVAGQAATAVGSSQRVANRRFTEATGWRPTVPSARDGWRLLADVAAAPSPSAAAPRWLRAALAFVALLSLPVGLWQQLAPRSFYDDFPGFGRVWVSVDGPYNEHLVRDLGSGTLALVAVALVALVRPSRPLVAAVGLALIVAQGPHALYHAAHLFLLPTTLDRVLNMALLPLFVAIGALLVGWSARPEPPVAAPTAPTPAPAARRGLGEPSPDKPSANGRARHQTALPPPAHRRRARG